MEIEFAEQLVRYFNIRQEERSQRVESVVAALNPRERKLVREAAVMGYVRGTMAGAVAGREGAKPEIPPDSFVLREVVDACLSMPDLYPTFERMERTAMRRERASG